MQTVYICVGLPGSGKSTHAKVVELTSHYSLQPVIRVNQDELGSRGICKDKTAEALANGWDVIVDRCNVSESQRKHWIDLAKRHGCRVVVELFDVDPHTCIRRASHRLNHETIKDPDDVPYIVGSQHSSWENPDFGEGIDQINVRNESGKVIKTVTKGSSGKPSLWHLFKRLFQ